MAYELSVSEVGPAEYPLIEVLRDTIFGETGHVFRTTLIEDLEARSDVFALIAHLEGNPVGFKIGYRFGPGVYYSKSGGVLKEYRRSGLARQMQTWQHSWLRARGYRQVYFNSFNRFKTMICFGLESGFIPVGVERRDEGEVSFKFVKDLTIPDRPLVKAEIGEAAENMLVQDRDSIELRVRHNDPITLRAALSAGCDMKGMLQDQKTGNTDIILTRTLPQT